VRFANAQQTLPSSLFLLPSSFFPLPFSPCLLPSMNGFLNLNKPPDFTSHDCVAKARRLLKMKRIGHAGTLDPAATGVLPIALGRATRLLQFLPGDKAYRATIRFGITTATDDLEGEILAQQPAADLTLEQIKRVLPQFLGSIQQVPPSYSAIQVNGQRLYDLARAGKAVDVPVRQVEVHSIAVSAWRSQEFPELEVEIACGSGTYIRAIARDLGQSVNTGATLATLQRTASSGFSLATSLTFEELETQLQQEAFQPIHPQETVKHLQAIVLPADLAKRWCQGQKLSLDETLQQTIPSNTPLDTPLRSHHEDGSFLGIGQCVHKDDQTLFTAKMVYAV
jgi:tRNA pseudouridine55 synthase